jgi:hypothetical protein
MGDDGVVYVKTLLVKSWQSISNAIGVAFRQRYIRGLPGLQTSYSRPLFRTLLD